jgi:ABC-type transport system involved in multi-copper enzyme maturation permease subunit
VSATSTEGLRPPASREPTGLGPVMRAEWVKFRTVRGWMAGLAIAVLGCVVFTYLVANGIHSGTCTGSGGTNCQSGHPFVPTGPDGQAVADSYQALTKPLTGDGNITLQVASLTGLISSTPVSVAPSLSATRPGLAGWAKAGILITPGTKQGSPYAAVMVTASHGIRFQYDYTNDRAGLSGTVSARSPRWIRLTRRGDTITGYDSANGTSWQKIGAAQLAGLPAAVDVGLFVTSPVSFQDGSGHPTQATATFSHIVLTGKVSGPWRSHSIGISQADFYPTLGGGSTHRSGTDFALTGSGDIAPAIVEGLLDTNTAASTLLLGLTVGLIVLIVISAMFITSEYRRGLIRTTFTATPQRGQVLAAKALVIGAVAFAIGAIIAAVAVPVGEHFLTRNGAYVFPASAAIVTRIVVGCGLVTALTAIAVLALGTMLRRSAGAVTAGIVVFAMPYVIGSNLSGGETWLFRLTPAAAYSVLGVLPRSRLVDYPYTFANGYYPLSPWAGLLVLGAYTAVVFGAARFLLTRRDT